VIQGTVVVLVACIVVGFYLYINDTVWKHVVSKVLLGQ
jgi:preprotein translocase subunit SecE